MKRGKIFVGFFLVLVLFFGVSLTSSCGIGEAVASTVDDLKTEAADYLCREYQTNGVRNSDNGVGSYALHVLKQAGVDIEAWKHDGQLLENAVVAAIEQDIAVFREGSAKALAQDLLAAEELNEAGLAEEIFKILQERESESGFDDNIYSDLHAYEHLGRADCLDRLASGYAKSYILERQAKELNGAYGGWGPYRWGNDYNADLMATTQALKALHYLDPQKADPEIQKAIEMGLAWMKDQQKDDGSFVAGMDDPLIDTAEVIVTLKLAGIDPSSWKSAAGKSAVDYLLTNALNADGSFGSCQNVMDAIFVLYATSFLTDSDFSQPSSEFRDIEGHWAAETIEMMAAAGYVKGISEDLFAPNMPVTRAQFATFLVRVLNVETQESQRVVFADVPSSYWGYPAIMAAYENELVSGVGKGRFEPEKKITRQEMAVMVVRALDKCGIDVELIGEEQKQIYANYSDAGRVSSWAQDAVAVCREKGIINGRTKDTIAPLSNTTRAEAIVVLKNMLEAVED